VAFLGDFLRFSPSPLDPAASRGLDNIPCSRRTDRQFDCETAGGNSLHESGGIRRSMRLSIVMRCASSEFSGGYLDDGFEIFHAPELGPLPAPLQTLIFAITMESQLSKPHSTRSALDNLRRRMAKKSTAQSAPPRTLTDFIEKFEQYSSSPKYPLNCYRGQRDAAWPIVAGIFRPEFKELLENERRAVRDLISVHPSEFASDETMFDKLVRMQHFGLPTRLLDVSQNALVALYFATDPGPADSSSTDGKVIAFSIPQEREKYYDSDSVSCIANLSNMTSEEKDEIYQLKESLIDLPENEQIIEFNKIGVIERLHQSIRSEKSYFQPVIKPLDLLQPYYVHPKMSNRRILAQSGAFIVYGLDPFKEIFFQYKIEQTSFLVPQEAKKTIQKALANLGISESTLFPELDKAAARIKKSYSR
jgi:hypothetical protein